MSTAPKLELAWEAIQEMCPTEANIQAYLGRIQEFCSYAEDTHLITISHRKAAAYYDSEQMKIAGEKRLADFISPTWLAVFQDKSMRAIDEAREFVERYYVVNTELSRNDLFQAIRDASRITHDLFTVFEACQPQYSSRLEPCIINLLPTSLPQDIQQEIIATLSLSPERNPLVEEEIAWSKVLLKLRKQFHSHLPSLLEYSYKELEDHARIWGLSYAADGHKPWSKESLYMRLQKDWSSTSRDVEQQAVQNKEALVRKQQELITKYSISQEVVRLCAVVATVSHIRLCLRIQGWMPVIHIMMNQLFPQLPSHVPYSTTQLECCRYVELMNILNGDYSLSTEELDRRNELVLFGILDGKEVLWSGRDAQEAIAQYIPQEDTNLRELRGQVAMKGKVRGICHVLNWHSENSAQEIEAMPEGAILVAGQTRPQLMSAIRKAAAIITDEGGITSHAAIVSRELAVPCVIGTKIATKVLKTGDEVEVDANTGIIRKL